MPTRTEELEYVVVSLGTGELNVQIRYEDAKALGNHALGPAARSTSPTTAAATPSTARCASSCTS